MFILYRFVIESTISNQGRLKFSIFVADPEAKSANICGIQENFGGKSLCPVCSRFSKFFFIYFIYFSSKTNAAAKRTQRQNARSSKTHAAEKRTQRQNARSSSSSRAHALMFSSWFFSRRS